MVQPSPHPKLDARNKAAAIFISLYGFSIDPDSLREKATEQKQQKGPVSCTCVPFAKGCFKYPSILQKIHGRGARNANGGIVGKKKGGGEEQPSQEVKKLGLGQAAL